MTPSSCKVRDFNFMSTRNVERALGHLRAAVALLEQPRAAMRHPEWFLATGQLSKEGIAHLQFLFKSGKSTYAAAKEMGISYRAAALRRKPKDAVL
jgi:hypothetical protein